MTEQSEQTDEWRRRFLGRGDLASGTAQLGETALEGGAESVRRVYQRTTTPDVKGSVWELTRRVARRKITCDESITAEVFVAEQVDGTESTTLYVTSPAFETGDRVFVESDATTECQANYEAVRVRSVSE